jgi:hypothetical protein
VYLVDLASPKTAKEFAANVSLIEGQAGYRRADIFGICLGIAHDTQNILFPVINKGTSHGSNAVLSFVCGHLSGSYSHLATEREINNALKLFGFYCDDRNSYHANIEVLKLGKYFLERSHKHFVSFAFYDRTDTQSLSPCCQALRDQAKFQ